MVHVSEFRFSNMFYLYFEFLLVNGYDSFFESFPNSVLSIVQWQFFKASFPKIYSIENSCEVTETTEEIWKQLKSELSFLQSWPPDVPMPKQRLCCR